MNSIVTVTTPATEANLASLATVKSALGISGTSEDASLQKYIAQASAKCASYCDRVFGRETVSEKFRIDRLSEALVLSRHPVHVLTSITVDGVLLLATEYDFQKENGIVIRVGSSDQREVWCRSVAVVVYSAGYDLASAAPPDLEEACIELVKHMRSAATRDPLAKRIEVPGVLTTDYWVGGVGSNGALPPKVVSLLEPYRRHHV